jgi:hypothetical protein
VTLHDWMVLLYEFVALHQWMVFPSVYVPLHGLMILPSVFVALHEWIVTLNVFVALHEWMVLPSVLVPFMAEWPPLCIFVCGPSWVDSSPKCLCCILYCPSFWAVFMVSIYIVHEKHYKFAPQKVTITTDRSRKSCVFFNIVDWFIYSLQNNKLLSDDIFPLYCETCNLTSEKSKVRVT